MCCSDEFRGWVSNNSPKSESCTSTSPCNPLELTGNFLVTVTNPGAVIIERDFVLRAKIKDLIKMEQHTCSRDS